MTEKSKGVSESIANIEIILGSKHKKNIWIKNINFDVVNSIKGKYDIKIFLYSNMLSYTKISVSEEKESHIEIIDLKNSNIFVSSSSI